MFELGELAAGNPARMVNHNCLGGGPIGEPWLAGPVLGGRDGHKRGQWLHRFSRRLSDGRIFDIGHAGCSTPSTKMRICKRGLGTGRVMVTNRARIRESDSGERRVASNGKEASLSGLPLHHALDGQLWMIDDKQAAA